MPLECPDCCQTMPSNPHSVVLSLPTLSDVICYEEKTLTIPVQAGYPRFVEGALLGSVQQELSRLIAARPCTSSLPPPLVILVTCSSFGESMLAWVRGSLKEGKEGEVVLLEDTCVVPGVSLVDYCMGGSKTRPPITWKEGVVGGGTAGVSAGWAALVMWTSSSLHHSHIAAAARVFQQHTGCRLNTRCAEGVGMALGVVSQSVAGCEGGEEQPLPSDGDARATIQALLQRIFVTPLPAATAPAAAHTTAKPPLLAPNGMAAFTAVYTAVQVASAMSSLGVGGWEEGGAAPTAAAAGKVRWGCPSHPYGRHCDMWLQVGCLYLDTAEVLKKFPAPPCPTCDALEKGAREEEEGGAGAHSSSSSTTTTITATTNNPYPHLLVCDPLDTPSLAATLAQWGGRLAGVVTEVPSNPLLLTTHLPTLATLIATHAPQACLVVDPTMAGLGNVNPAPHADAVVCSLTKFLGCAGDVMGGGVMVGGGGVCGGPNVHRLAQALDVCNGLGSISSSSGGDGDGGEATLKPLRLWCSPYLPWAWGASSSSSSRSAGLQPHHHPHQCCPPPMPSGSARKLALAAPTLPTTLARMNASTVQVARWLEARLSTDRAAAAAAAAATSGERSGSSRQALRLRAVHWVLGDGSPRSRENYLGVATRGGSSSSSSASGSGSGEGHGIAVDAAGPPGCMITLELEGTWPLAQGFSHGHAGELLSRFYGGLQCVKGPSFGTLFTLASPFIYLAHYDQVVCEQGREELCKAGINPYLVRLSVGVEPVEDIIAALEAAFAC